MPDSLGPNGLTVKTAAEITADLTTGFQGIYGGEINTDSNSPDGQMIGILTQMCVDLRELIVQVNASFDPDQAQGVILAQRGAINGVAPNGGTYTTQPITIVTNATVTLQGLDANAASPTGTGYTAQDGSGNQFILLDTTTLTAGTHSLNFRAQQVGAVNVPINTITDPLTVVPGVVSVNNPSTAISVGQNQEMDPQFRTRRAQSVSNASAGYLNGLQGKLAQLSGVIAAKAYENVTDSTDGNGIPAHGIWAIVNGGSNSDIANTIYNCKSDGTPTKGSVTQNIVTPSGVQLPINFDRPNAVNLYAQFTIKTTVPGYVFDTTSIANYIAANQAYTIGSFAETSSLVDQAQAGIAGQGGGGVPVLMQVSADGVAWTNFLSAPALNDVWTLSASRISITVI